MAFDPAAPPLVSPEWLAGRLADPALRIIDIRSSVDGGGRAAYEQGHVPGAVHTDYARDGWRAVSGMAAGLLPDASHLAQLLARLGLQPERHVIIVPAGTTVGDFSAAARVYWTLKIAGHTPVSILDGGMAAWRRDPARSVELGPSPGMPPAPPYPVRLVAGLRSDVAAVEQAVAGRNAVLLDSRALGYFEGREKSPQALRAGRLPGAIMLDHTVAFDPAAGRLKPQAELAALFARVPQRPVVNYCNTGHQAATNWFILSELLRRPGVTLYDGSMSEWTEDPARAAEAGPAPHS
jgi:thiosulfate/3-mercaptopyruvate sulfurtransferase